MNLMPPAIPAGGIFMSADRGIRDASQQYAATALLKSHLFLERRAIR